MKPKKFSLVLAGVLRAAVTTLARWKLLLLLSSFPLHAQPFTLDWHKVSGGGGTSTNSRFTITGTIGQVDASPLMTGGRYAVGGGFWSLYAVQTPGAPELGFVPVPQTITYVTNTVAGPNYGQVTTNNSPAAMQLSWPSGLLSYTVQTNGNLSNPGSWADYGVPVNDNGSVRTLLISLPAGSQAPQQLFFRLRQ